MAHVFYADTTQKIADWVDCNVCNGTGRNCTNPDCVGGFVLKRR